MALAPGVRLGPYEITAQIGVGEHRPLMSCPNLTRGGLQP